MPTDLEHDFEWREGVVRWGREGEGPPVVLCHGTPWSSQLWEGTARALSSRWTVYRWDMVGYGVSEQRAGQDVSLAAHGELFSALVDRWGLERPAVVGTTTVARLPSAHICRTGGRSRRWSWSMSWRWRGGARRSSASCASRPQCSSSCHPSCIERWCVSTSAVQATGGCERSISTGWSRHG
jgi:hypothetical protein